MQFNVMLKSCLPFSSLLQQYHFPYAHLARRPFEFRWLCALRHCCDQHGMTAAPGPKDAQLHISWEASSSKVLAVWLSTATSRWQLEITEVPLHSNKERNLGFLQTASKSCD